MKSIFLSSVFAAMLAVPAPVVAQPSFGLGLSFVFGSGVAAGARVFSTDRPQKGALSLGIDYKFASGTWRPTVGAAYLDNDIYLDLNLGFDTGSGLLDYGIGVGGLGGMESQ
jgi:hypothetical protein